MWKVFGLLECVPGDVILTGGGGGSQSDDTLYFMGCQDGLRVSSVIMFAKQHVDGTVHFYHVS